jgi:hypothetical protein
MIVERLKRRSRFLLWLGIAIGLMGFYAGSDVMSVRAYSRSVLEARLGVKPMIVSPGEKLQFRVENRGDSPIAYGGKFVIQEETYPRVWGPAAFTPKGPWADVLANLEAGQSERWNTLEIPQEADVGRYRIKKEIKTLKGRRFLLGGFVVRALE